MITVTVFYRDHCQDCDQVLADLESLQEVIPHQLVTINLDHDKLLRDKVGSNLPVIEIGPYHLQPPFTRQDLQVLLSAARDRISQMDQVQQTAYQKRLKRGHSVSTGDKISAYIAKHYLALINIFLLLYVGLPFLAPVLMKYGQTLPATVIYKIYNPLCHQLAYRSWFLFGEQTYYPRALAGIPNVMTYEMITNSNVIDINQARNFIGTPVIGYKVAFCERDIAIYAAMLLFGLIFAATGRRMGAISWTLWLLVGVIPMGLDGGSQLLNLATGLPAWVPIRESTPFLRSLTGTLFGWVTAWYLFPMIEQSTRETLGLIQRKTAVAQQTGARD